MGSSNKTTNLGLNKWLERDSPKRSDFVSDNVIIDNLLGNHIKDSSLHLTAQEKQRASQPFDVNTIYGTGEATTQIKFGYTPKLAIVCKKNNAPCVMGSSYTKVNFGIASPIGGSGGISISDYTVTLTQSPNATNGVLYDLNNSQYEYLLITFK